MKKVINGIKDAAENLFYIILAVVGLIVCAFTNKNDFDEEDDFFFFM